MPLTTEIIRISLAVHWGTQMVIAFNETTVAAQPIDNGVVWQRLLTDNRVKDTSVLLDRLTLAAGATVQFEPSAKSLGWLQLLEGEATLKSLETDRMSDSSFVILPPGFNVTLSTSKGATLLYAEIMDAGRFDPGFLTSPPLFMVIDWTREPVFDSEHDARKRVSLVNPEVNGTAAIKVDMAIYPPGSTSPNHHNEGADAFMYFLSGRGTAWANEQPFPVRQGDLVCFPNGERHCLKAADDSEIRILQFSVPGKFKTVWADPRNISAWRSTGRDIHGGETALDERVRDAYGHILGNPFTR
jgi:quercetin dioxygenase-like cupin family protein